MSSFTDPLRIEELDHHKWRILRSLRYYIKDEDGPSIVVPRGFTTDGGSIPRVAWPLVGHPWDDGGKAYVLHDYCYASRPFGVDRKRADEILCEALEVLGFGWLRRSLIYRAVRLFGGAAWERHRRNDT